ncbi:formylmethanofuran dehydrogenase subunit B [Rhodospirillaceae bacterium SYSU D60014]|uniref:formylmethanofuran dehydrogenase subunit B n=1 Tax=Virgifigura deserti TaxID=2268457 RepID=UPI000E661AC2
MAAERTLWRDVVCPFCGLACDDLAIEREGDRLSVREAGCARSRAQFERPQREAEPQIDGNATDLASAVARAADLLQDSRLPLFAGLATDVDGMRAVMQLADRIGGVVDHAGSDALFRNLRILQDSGWITTTLSEVRNRMDLLLIVGHWPEEAFPRFIERCVEPEQTLSSDAPLVRQIVRVGPPAPDGSAAKSGPPVLELPCAIERLPEAVAALRCLVNEQQLAASEVAGIPVAGLRELAERLRSARYGVIAWAAADLTFAGAELTVQALSALVQDLNRTTRCALLPLTGTDNLIGVNQVCTWQSGYPLRTGFGRGIPEHDLHLFSAQRLLDTGEADALVWISAFREASLPVASGVPTVVIATPGTTWTNPPAVFIPVGTPGMDHKGSLFRMDSVVMLRLAALRDSPLPSVATAISQIDAALAARKEA